MICWELEAVLKKVIFSLDEIKKIEPFITLARVILVYRDKALEIIVID